MLYGKAQFVEIDQWAKIVGLNHGHYLFHYFATLLNKHYHYKYILFYKN